jgi:hypothetical protein
VSPELKRNTASVFAITIFLALAIGSSDTNDARRSSGNSSSIGSQSDSSRSQASPKQVALRDVKLDFKWSKGGFGSVMEADFTIENPTNYTIKDME